MSSSLFSTTFKTGLFIVGFVCLALFQALALNTLEQSHRLSFFADWAVYAVTYSGLCLLLWYTIKYAGKGLSFAQSIINHLMFVLLFVAISNGSAYLVFELLELLPVFMSSLGVRLFISILVYIILYQIILEKSKRQATDTDEDNLKDSNDENPPEKISEEPVLDHIAVKQGQKIHVIPVQDILFLQAEGDYVMIYTAKTNFLKEQTMKTFENQLPKNMFVRVHRSFIVNVEAILGIETNEKQQYLLLLKGGYEVKASVSGYKQLKHQLKL